MTKKFENKKLNKEDHAKVDKDASIVRGVAEGVGTFGTFLGLGVVIFKNVLGKKGIGAISKVFFRG